MKTHKSSDKLDEKTPIPPPDWEALIAQVADDIMKEHSPSQILKIRAKFYDLLTHCIPASTILKSLAFELVRRVDAPIRSEVMTWAAFYEHRIRLGSVSIHQY
jgi:replication factor C subunit 3/5